MPIIPAQLRSAVRFQLDGLRLHPHRRLIIAGLIAGLLGTVWLAVYSVHLLRSAPPPPPPPKPLALLPELSDSADRLSDLRALTGLTPPPGWRLIAAPVNARADGPSSKSWLFMQAKPEGRPVKADEFTKLSPKPAAAASAPELAEALALSINRLSVGKPVSALSTPMWEAPNAAAARFDVLELEQVVIARVTWFAKR